MAISEDRFKRDWISGWNLVVGFALCGETINHRVRGEGGSAERQGKSQDLENVFDRQII